MSVDFSSVNVCAAGEIDLRLFEAADAEDEIGFGGGGEFLDGILQGDVGEGDGGDFLGEEFFVVVDEGDLADLHWAVGNHEHVDGGLVGLPVPPEAKVSNPSREENWGLVFKVT